MEMRSTHWIRCAARRWLPVLALALVLGLPMRAEAQRILVYGPGGTGSVTEFSGTPTVTVASEAMWRAMTTAEFGAFDLIWVDGNNCVSTPSIHQAFIDTQATWGPAARGRAAINFSDPDLHAPGAATATTFIRNNQTWLSALGATAEGGATGLYFSTGCVYFRDNGPPYISSYEPTFGAPLRNVFINGEPDVILDGAHPLMAGLTIPTIMWGYFCHGGVETTIPAGWTPLIGCPGTPRRYGVIVRGPTAVCGNGMIEAGETCDDGNTVSCDGCSSVCLVDTVGCDIGGTCVADGTLNPANDCEECDRATSSTAYSPVAMGTTCDDGMFCTVTDTCDGAGTCGGLARDCSDGLACTTDTCDDATDMCVSTIAMGCIIGGVCIADGTLNPANACERCDVTMATDAYSPVPMGTMCDDGMFCTVMDACDGARACVGMARDCSDAFDCTTDACDDTMDMCTNTVSTGCLIDGACVAEGVDPGNECRTCDPTADTATWTPLPAGTACDDGVTCTETDACDGMGMCEGSARACDDGLDCTTDGCDDTTGECINNLRDGCLIGGVCVATGAANPDNDCEVCEPTTATDTYSASADGTACGTGSGMCCVSGMCSSDPMCVPDAGTDAGPRDFVTRGSGFCSVETPGAGRSPISVFLALMGLAWIWLRRRRHS